MSAMSTTISSHGNFRTNSVYESCCYHKLTNGSYDHVHHMEADRATFNHQQQPLHEPLKVHACQTALMQKGYLVPYHRILGYM